MRKADSQKSSNVFGSRLRDIRRKQGFRQVELARRANLCISTVNKIENWGFPVSKPTADKLARALNCKPSEIFPDAGK